MSQGLRLLSVLRQAIEPRDDMLKYTLKKRELFDSLDGVVARLVSPGVVIEISLREARLDG